MAIIFASKPGMLVCLRYAVLARSRHGESAAIGAGAIIGSGGNKGSPTKDRARGEGIGSGALSSIDRRQPAVAASTN
jgi:hypothetical protein